MKRQIITLILAAAAAAGAQAQLLYKVSGNGLEQPSYLFGTHHMAPLSMVDSVKGTRTALQEASKVVGEIDMTVGQMALAAKLQPMMLAPADSTLSRLVGAEKIAALEKEFAEWSPMPGLTLAALDVMKPACVTQMVIVGVMGKKLPGYNPQEQLDTWFQQQAKASGKEIVALETPEQQGQLLYCTLPLSKQAEAMVKLLDNPTEAVEEAEALNAAYFSRNLARMDELSRESSDTPEFYEAMLLARNRAWLAELPAIMKSGSSFIAVGALHLAGADGLVEQLRKLGYTVEAVD